MQQEERPVSTLIKPVSSGTKSKPSYQLKFFYLGQQYKPSLGTSSEREAEVKQREIDRTLELLKEGILKLPEDASRQDVLRFVKTGGREVTRPPRLKKEPPSKDFSYVLQKFKEHRQNLRAETTFSTEVTHLGHLTRLIKVKKLKDITTGVLQRYVNKRLKEKGIRKRKLSPLTVKKELVTFQTMWKFSIAQGYIEEAVSPTKGVELPKTDELEHFLTWDQCEKIIEQGGLDEDDAKSVWDRLFLDFDQVGSLVKFTEKYALHPFVVAAVAFAAYTGARRSEIMRSKVEDWDFQGGTVKIRSLKMSRKSNMSFRNIPIHPELARIMQDWFKHHHPGGEEAILIPEGVGGKPGPRTLDPDSINAHFRTTFDGTEWEVIRGWHTLRHSFCSNCARNNLPDAVIDSWMGHQGDEAVKKRYRHLFPQDEVKYMQNLT